MMKPSAKMVKWRYFRILRLDSHYILKILISFNAFLALYLLFLSTNYRRTYVEYPRDIQLSDDAISSKVPNVSKNEENPDQGDPNPSLKDSKILPLNVPPNEPLAPPANDEPPQDVNKKIRIDPISRVYDGNNHPVKQDAEDVDDPESSFKKVEEDDKTIDENDKLKFEMLDAKPYEQNSILHTDVDFTERRKGEKNRDANGMGAEKAVQNGDLNKDVINRIMDHNSQIKKNDSKVIVPDNINIGIATVTAEHRGKYRVLVDYIPGNAQINFNRTITYTTQGTPEFLHHVEQLCSRWGGPVSVAVYAPRDDFRLAVNMIYYLRQCGKKCVADNVFWHMVYDYPMSSTYFGPTHYLETQNFFCNVSIVETMKKLKLNSNFRMSKGLPYPINVLRNVARYASKSKYVLASDIELYPSVGIIPAFFDMLEREKAGMIPMINTRKPHVYVLPIFEVNEKEKPPETKKELIKLYRKNKAIFFHRYVCDQCQHFPGRLLWIKQMPKNESILNAFGVTQRSRDKNSWEPIYIGTNDEPPYDERLTWEGKRDKMGQMLHMCLLGYDLVILDNAFLVHAPGIKHHSNADDNKRMKYIVNNSRIYHSTVDYLRKKYGNLKPC